jgi:6-phosphogluconolactonase
VIREARVFANDGLMTHAIAEESMRIAQEAVTRRGRCVICLSGGRTPKALNELWARDYSSRMPWNQIYLFWGDERYVPADDPHSNYRMARESLIAHVAIPAQNIHAMPTNYSQADEAAREYEAELRRFFGAQPEFDIFFLGVGAEGHCASLFPGSPALNETQRWVVSAKVPAEPPQRLTLTYPVINRAREVFFLAAGKGKREIVQAIRRDPGGPGSPYPAARVDAERVIWFVDQAAAF